MVNLPIRACFASLAAVPFVLGCSSGPEPSDALWVRWTAQTTNEDAEETAALKVCGHAAAAGDSPLGVEVPVDVALAADGGLRVTVPVDAGGTVRRVVSRELIVGRWPYGGSKSEVAYWVKDGDPLPAGLDAPAPGSRRAASVRPEDESKGPAASMAAAARPAPSAQLVPIARPLTVSGVLEIRRQAAPADAPRIVRSSSTTTEAGSGVLEFEIPAAELEAAFPNRGRDPEGLTSSSPRFELFVDVTCESAPPVSCRIRRQPVLTDRDVFPASARAAR